MTTSASVQHTPACIAGKAAFEAWVAKWPRYHEQCGASGCHYYGGSYNAPPEWDVCSCIENGYCPRCGSTTVLWVNGGSELHCALCGWNEDDICNGVLEDRNGASFITPPWECWCEIEATRAAEDDRMGLPADLRF